MGKEEEAKQEEDAFAEEDIDQILAGRSEKRQIGSRKGNTFSTATFSTNEVSFVPCTALFLYPFSCHRDMKQAIHHVCVSASQIKLIVS